MSKIKNLNARLPADLKDEFARFCNNNGDVIQKAAGGSVLLFMSLPSDIREYLKQGNVEEVKKWFADREDALNERIVLRSKLEEAQRLHAELSSDLKRKARGSR